MKPLTFGLFLGKPRIMFRDFSQPERKFQPSDHAVRSACGGFFANFARALPERRHNYLQVRHARSQSLPEVTEGVFSRHICGLGVVPPPLAVSQACLFVCAQLQLWYASAPHIVYEATPV